MLLALGALLLAGNAAAPADRCGALRGLARADLTIERAEALADRFVAPDGARIAIPRLCRVRGVARPAPRSRIAFELWLPEQWNGRYYQLGNGGFAGWIHYPSLAADAARGNAVALTDTGHSGGGLDASWAAGRPERVADYAHRSIKATADAARTLIQAYYDRSPAHRYFAGCSNGGRQALVAAERYPEDWDGVIAGAPATPWTSQLADFAAIQHRLRVEPGGWLPPAKLPAIQRAALAACPAASVAEGVAFDPRQCRFDPAALRCRGADTDQCLTPGQIGTVRMILHAGFEPTGAALAGGWADWIVRSEPSAPSQLTFATQAFRHLFRDAPGWRIEAFDAKADRVVARRLAPLLDAGADLARFRARGGKIISYFGWADPLIAPRRGVDHHRRVAARSGGAQDFYRLFMVPGMLHCQGGPGPASFGQSLPAPALADDSRHDIRRALEAWVEQGVAPDALVAARYVDGDPAKGVAATRVLRPFTD